MQATLAPLIPMCVSVQPKLQPLVREISWAKNLVIFTRCTDELEREFYLRATARFGWTKAILQHQVDNKSYEKYLLNQTNFDKTLSPELQAQAVLAVKDRYTFDFLELADEHSERELEQALVKNLRRFLSEMGGAFTFIGNQHRLESSTLSRCDLSTTFMFVLCGLFNLKLQRSFLNDEALMAAKRVEPGVILSSSAAARTISAISFSPFAERTTPTLPSESNSSVTVHFSRFRALIASGFFLNRIISRDESSKSDSPEIFPVEIRR